MILVNFLFADFADHKADAFAILRFLCCLSWAHYISQDDVPAAFPASWRGLGHPGYISAVCGSFQFLAKFIYGSEILRRSLIFLS